MDGYGTTALTCGGYRLEEMAYVGFWFGRPDHVMQVDVRKDDAGQLQSAARLIEENHLPLTGPQPWACQIE